MTEKTSLLVLCFFLTAGSVFGQGDDLISVPQCIANEDCAETQTCVDLRCEDPCPDLCKSNANCQVRKHVAYCSCKPGFAGDPFTGCSQQPTTLVQCVTHEDCPRDRVCDRQRCEDPCLGVCGNGSVCHVVDHVPYCACRPGYYGDPISRCTRQYPPGSWPPFPGAKKRYQVQPIKTNWYAAFALCMNSGGRLAVIENAEENEKIKEEIRRSGLKGLYWVSGMDWPLKTHWTWMSTGKPFTFMDWSNGQPDNFWSEQYPEHCTELWDNDNLHWNNRGCKELEYSVCEFYDYDS